MNNNPVQANHTLAVFNVFTENFYWNQFLGDRSAANLSVACTVPFHTIREFLQEARIDSIPHVRPRHF